MERKLMSLPPSTSIPEMEPNGTFSNNNSNGNCTIENFKKDFYPTVYLIIFVWGTLGNGFSIYVFLQSYKKSTSVNVFMLNLAISDFLFTSTLPFRADYYLRGSNWIFGDLTCRIMSYSLYVNMYSSIYFLTVLSIVRFLATVHPFRLLHIASIRSAWTLCGIIWILIMAAAVVLLNNGSERKGSAVLCLELNINKIVKLQTMNYIALVMGFLLPFCMLSICYLLIIRALLKVEVPESGLRVSHKKALITIIIALIIFLLCFLPYHILRTLHLLVWEVDICEEKLHKAVVITLALAGANSCLNPLLYYFAGENFKEKLRSTLKKDHLQKTKYSNLVCMCLKKETQV
ncbi:cysteinyl leukotriene receptor 2 isoform X2 [Ailuropoda melanoleuca]|uniref:Cysteinyl leukotriene receptor 2 n=2 Tax=Ailuropoda melanoleuca TaxID=9646 RepID=G1MJZ6_AILME|nr:cysteinyl leukotriene receptor 2 isoform X2 [Ailuropoda melanoleuca]XP_034521061.1 cysteinyl leukotriene receptor 2 isoform X2 [Ailuropoda melanoleuca]XP_034521062.1 cysteinyl leukotriene receptor 2 isoform X2 [Ailuropoda melanoleuca]XP_034521063.1 cysteinyl leukotriene receptor 2 isoform X2 [Ailuropoda melanoleuca]XP_034521064.1 cysteinyl leukotriene receptor 2 isoform X2 [Ailuropoda melanoleuca]XP_034521065.1 cysteinyl leukotriene receptor 2 isoform X2 [Ailuropoda melanoleuca]